MEVSGNRRTRLDRILSVLDVGPGHPLDEHALEAARIRLLGTGLFRRVSMRLRKGSARGKVVLVVEVEERPTLRLSSLTLGTTAVSPLYAGFGLSDVNVLGAGLTASGAFVVGPDQRFAARLSLHDPSLFETGFLVGLTAQWVRGVELDCPTGLGTCRFGDFDRLRYRRTGGIASIGLPAARHYRVFLHYRFEDLEALTLPSPLRLRTDLPALALPPIAEGRSVISSLAVSFDFDSRPDAFLARSGTHLVVSAEVSSQLFFGSYDYSRYKLEIAQHFPGLADHALRVSFFGGLVQGNAPFFDRFHPADHSYFTIGANTVPRVLEVSFTEVSNYDAVLLSAGIEYAVPLHRGGRFFYRSYLYVAAAATVSSPGVDRSVLDLSFDPQNEISRFPLSGDLGVRIDSAIGIFRLGLSYPLDQVF